jgi:hypothetical protein
MTYTMRQYLQNPTKPHHGPGSQASSTPAQAQERLAAIVDPLVAKIQAKE